MDENRYENRQKIYEIMWTSKAGCIDLDEKTCLDLVWRLCDLLEEEHKSYITKGLFGEHVDKAKSEIPESFRRSFVKALLEVETKNATRGIITTVPLLFFLPAILYFIFTEAGKAVLPVKAPSWLSSNWMLSFIILGILFSILDTWFKVSTIKNARQRAEELEKLLL